MAVMSYLQPTAAQLQSMFEQTGIFASYDSEGTNVLLNCYDSDNTKRVSVSTSYVITFYGDNFTLASTAAPMAFGCTGAVIFINSRDPSEINHAFAITKSNAGDPAVVTLPTGSTWGTQKCASTTSSSSYASTSYTISGAQLYGASVTSLIPFVLAPGDNAYDYTDTLYLALVYETVLYAGSCQIAGKNYLQVGRFFALDVESE